MHGRWVDVVWLLGSLALLGAPSGATARGREAKVEKHDVNWRMSGVKVVQRGETVQLPADRASGFPGGTMTKDHVLEGRVKARRGALVPDGFIRLTLSAFSPTTDMPGQKAGFWYVEGKWVIVDAKADRNALAVRHNPHVVEGRIKAALPFNPATHDQPWTARATLPGTRAGGTWARSVEGNLTFDLRQGPDLSLVLQTISGTK